jgi:hypothetical protein
LTKPSLIASTRAFSKRSADSKSFIGFGIIHGVVSRNWNVNGQKPFTANLKKLVGGILRLLFRFTPA